MDDRLLREPTQFAPPEKPAPRVHSEKAHGDIVLGTSATPGYVVGRDWAHGGKVIRLRRLF